MVREIASSDVSSPEPHWQEIQAALEEIAELSTAGISSRDFHAALIEKAAHALFASAGAVWLRSPNGELAREAEWNFNATGLSASADMIAAHQQLVATVCARGEPCRLPAFPTVKHDQAGGQSLPAEALNLAARGVNPTSWLLVLSPLKLGNESIGAIELCHPTGATVLAEREALPLLSAMGELATDFQRQGRLREFAVREGHWRGLEQFIQAAHDSLELRPTAQAIVNEGRRLIGCDRLSLAVLRSGKCRLTAVSGTDQVERRSNLVQRLEALGRCALVYGEPLWYPADRERLAPELESALDACLDETHARVFGVLPICKRPPDGRSTGELPPVGMLFVEQFHAAAAEPDLVARTEAVGRHAASALANAVEYESLPLLPLERGLRGLRWLTKARQLPKTIAFGLVALLAAAFLMLYPADFAIEARGELQPRIRRDVFAPSDSIVSEIHLAEGRAVRKGDVLVTLRRPQLDFEMHRVLGETQTARKRLAGVQAARLGPERGKTDTTQRYNQLTAEEEELKEQLASLSEQEQNLRAQQAELEATSPIDGQVLTWDVEQLLESRPVQRGQVLLAVGDLAGPWQLELRLPDDHAGYVLAAEQAIDPQLDVDFILATDPSTTYHGRIEKTALAAQTDEVYGAHVLLTVAIDQKAVGGLRPGASVIGKIQCGRRAIGFVWFHDLISIIRRRLLF